MKITNKLNSVLKIQLLIYLTLCLNFSFANTETGLTSNSNLSATDVNDFSEKPKKEKRQDSSKKKSNNNYHDIISSTGDCAASCCASINSAQKVGDVKKKSNDQKLKKKFRWFSRSK